MMTRFEKRMLWAFIRGRTDQREATILSEELAAAESFLPSLKFVLDELIIHHALLAAGLKREKTRSIRKGDPVIYRRNAA